MPFGTGALQRPADIRDYHLGLAAAPVQLPDTYLPDHSNLPIKFQGKYGTCGAHAGAALESFQENADFAPKYLWKQIKQIDGVPLDAGTNMRAIFKALQAKGVCHETLCPDVLDPTLQQYSDIGTITDVMLIDAYPHGIASYAFIDNPSWDQIRQAIFQHGAVIARLDCGTGWYTPSWLEKDILPLKLGNYESGHFVVLSGYDQNYIYFRNSWSDTWGRRGDGYFDHSYLPHVTEIGTAIDGPSLKQTVVSLLTKLVFLLQQKLLGR